MLKRAKEKAEQMKREAIEKADQIKQERQVRRKSLEGAGDGTTDAAAAAAAAAQAAGPPLEALSKSDEEILSQFPPELTGEKCDLDFDPVRTSGTKNTAA